MSRIYSFMRAICRRGMLADSVLWLVLAWLYFVMSVLSDRQTTPPMMHLATLMNVRSYLFWTRNHARGRNAKGSGDPNKPIPKAAQGCSARVNSINSSQ